MWWNLWLLVMLISRAHKFARQSRTFCCLRERSSMMSNSQTSELSKINRSARRPRYRSLLFMGRQSCLKNQQTISNYADVFDPRSYLNKILCSGVNKYHLLPLPNRLHSTQLIKPILDEFQKLRIVLKIVCE